MKNRLYYGDNLTILREHIPDSSVDLIYLDPPFNSKTDYNILFREPDDPKQPFDESSLKKTPEELGSDAGEERRSQSQITAFEDTWHWTEETESALKDIRDRAESQVVDMIEALRGFVGVNDMMAYLVMMCVRLIELRRVLKDTGSLYLHCDSTASHYLKIVLDTIFGKENFRNEIIWKRTLQHNLATKSFDKITDTLFFYSKSHLFAFYTPYIELDQKEMEQKFTHIEKETGRKFQHLSVEGSSNAYSIGQTRTIQGKEINTKLGWKWTQDTFDERLKKNPNLIYWTTTGRPRYKIYADEYKGRKIPSFWGDIPGLSSTQKERLGYPTQKPLALLERIILASSKEGDIILDPFCGCGTAVVASQKLNRRWIGIDITHLAVNLMKYRLSESFPELKEDQDYEIVGVPQDVEGAVELFQKDPYQFEWWALSLISAKPSQNKKKGADGGVDGVIYFEDYDSKKKRFVSRKAIVQVKGGKVGLEQMKAFSETMRVESAELGIFLTLNGATYPMEEHARKLGQYESMSYAFSCPRIQIYRIQSLLEERIQIQLPPHRRDFHKRAQTQKDAPNLLF